MALIRIIKDWQKPDLLRQTPGGRGEWGGHTFTLAPVERCDYAVILNRVPENVTLTCPPEHVWLIVQEPPVPHYRWLRKGFDRAAHIYTPDPDLHGERFIPSHGALPWHVGKTYDELKAARPPEKPHNLSWITSSLGMLKGHRQRMRFLQRLKTTTEFDLWGRGFTPIPDKWDGLAPYRYALAVENHVCAHYWTEKVMDCFLSWTLPIYHGATDLARYFPEEAFVRIDIRDRSAPKLVKEIIAGDLWRKRRDAVEHARNLVLDTHQFFPFIAAQIAETESREPAPAQPAEIRLEALADFGHYYRETSLPRRLWNGLMRRIKI